MVEKYKWRRVEAPKAWVPSTGEELVGFFVGRTLRQSVFVTGQYEVILVAVPGMGVRMVTGTQLIQLVDAAQLAPGDPVRIIFLGYKDTANKRQIKLFDLYITDGDKAAVDDLPEIDGAKA